MLYTDDSPQRANVEDRCETIHSASRPASALQTDTSSSMSLPLRYQFALALVAVNIIGTAALAAFAYQVSRTSLENQATRAVGVVAQARDQALVQLLQRRQERMDAFLESVESLCGERATKEKFGWESECVRVALSGFQTAERASAADLRYGG